MINTDLRQNTVSLRIAIFHIPTATKQNYLEQMVLSILATEGRCVFSKWILGKKNRPYATTSNYCIISSFGNAPPATTALSHHLAMHCQQLLHYNISWQCTAFPHYWSSEIIAVNKQKKLPLIFTKTFFAQVLNLLFNQ